MTETQLKTKVLRWIKRTYKRAWVYKAADRFTSGIPDIIICLDSRLIAIELKTARGRATPLQLHTLSRIQAAGGVARICRSLEDVKRVFNEKRRGRQ